MWVEFAWNGLARVPRFFRDGIEVTQCPGCGDALSRAWIEEVRHDHE
jgi:pyruvate/2-oxoacid:ferredoxin oxidoreductase beta subunit